MWPAVFYAILSHNHRHHGDDDDATVRGRRRRQWSRIRNNKFSCSSYWAVQFCAATAVRRIARMWKTHEVPFRDRFVRYVCPLATQKTAVQSSHFHLSLDSLLSAATTGDILVVYSSVGKSEYLQWYSDSRDCGGRNGMEQRTIFFAPLPSICASA